MPGEDPDNQSLLTTYLSDRGVPCPSCRYDLRNLTGDRCPECGQQLVLGVHLVEPKQAAFIAGLIGLAWSSGFSFFALSGWFWDNVFEGSRIYFDDLFYISSTGFIVSLGLLFFWLWGRHLLIACAQWTNWLLAASCWLVPIVITLLLLIFVV